jgi:hypothetical protein
MGVLDTQEPNLNSVLCGALKSGFDIGACHDTV